MGKSPQERAAGDMYNNAGMVADRNINEAKTLSSQMTAESLAGIRSGISDAEGFLKQASGARIQGLGSQLGDMMASLGIAPGHDAAGAWVAQMSPLFAQENASLADLYGKGMSLETSVRQSAMQQLIDSISRFRQMEESTKMGAIEGMSDSTPFGDVMAGFMSAAQLTLAALTGGGSIPLSVALSGSNAITDYKNGTK